MSARFNPHAPDWHRQEDIPPDITLSEYAEAWIDMAPHVKTLTALAADAKVVVEFGIRGGVSTWALLDGLPEDGRLYGVDIDPNAPMPPRVKDDPRFTFLVGDSLKVKLPKRADLVLIDSSHEFTQTVLELQRAASLRPAMIVCHDYLYEHTPQVRWAIDGWTHPPYTEDHWSQVPYRLRRVEESRWGLAILVPR